jgi:hypothetical protein
MSAARQETAPQEAEFGAQEPAYDEAATEATAEHEIISEAAARAAAAHEAFADSEPAIEEPPESVPAPHGAAEPQTAEALTTTVLPQDMDTTVSPEEDSASHALIPEEALEFNPDRTDAAAVFVAAPEDPEWTAATGTFKALSAGQPQGNENHPVDSAYLATMLRAAAPGAVTAAPAAASEKPPAAPQEPPIPTAAAAASPEDVLGIEPAAQQPSFLARVPKSVWRIGAPLALLLLLAQIVNHNRDDLAASPRFNGPLTALYGALGVRLVPSWDLRAYDVRQLGAEASPPGSGLITVRASIKNGAPQRQPLPLLRVTLQDRFGNRIAARDVAPRLYLPPAAAAMSSLSAGQRIDAAMGFVDPGANAVGFEIDACLPASAGGIACANDSAAR